MVVWMPGVLSPKLANWVLPVSTGFNWFPLPSYRNEWKRQQSNWFPSKENVFANPIHQPKWSETVYE